MRTALAAVLSLTIAGCDAEPPRKHAEPAATAPPVAVTAPKPKNAFEWQLARLPEPNKVAAFVLDGTTEFGGLTGTCRIAAEPATFEGQTVWRVEETHEDPAFPGLGTEATTERSTTWLSRELRVLRRESVATSESEKTTSTATNDGTKVTRERNGYRPETINYVRGVESAHMGLAAALLYLRMCPAAVVDPNVDWASYPRVTSVDPDGGLHCEFNTNCQTFIELRGPNRVPVKIEEFIGDHPWRTIVAR